MSFGRVQPAHIDFSDPAAARSPQYDDIYHPRSGALAQARQVFVGGNGLPERWRGRDRFVVLETGFGLGHNFLATWAAWREDPQRPARLWFLSLDKHPPTREDLARAHAASALPGLARELLDAWPPATPDIHALTFDGGGVNLLLALGDVAAVLPQWVAQVDAFYLDGFAPARNPAMWHPHVLQRLPRLAAPGATLATWSVAHAVRDTLAAAGFEVQRVPGFGGGKREITLARFAPRHRPPLTPGRQGASACRSALVLGAGLAGAATARALAEHGVACTVLDAGSGPAQQTSGNAGGLFHGVVHADEAPHARWFRACALQAERQLRPLLAAGRLPGALDGLLRQVGDLDLAAMQARLAGGSWPAAHVQAVDGAHARALAGLAAGGPAPPAWFYPGGGWVSPAALTALLLQHAGIETRFHTLVHHIGPEAKGWCARDSEGRTHRADVLVLANAHDATRLAAPFAGTAWPALQRVRGQVTLLPASALAGQRLIRPLAGSGYALSLPDGRLLCGATSQADDDEPALRDADHAINLQRLAALTGLVPGAASPLQGRVGWRLLAPDRLPLLGPVPAAGARPARIDQPRLMPRVPGLYVHTALGSRGIAQSLLGGAVLAGWITGAPLPVPAALLDAVDVARFAARAARQS